MSAIERLYTPPQVGAPGRSAALDRTRRLRRTGLFVLLMAIALIMVSVLLRYRAVTAIHLSTHLPFTDGLAPGSLVEQAGYTVGSVVGITPTFPETDGSPPHCAPTLGETTSAPAAAMVPLQPCFRIQLRIKHDWLVPSDSVAVIGSKLLQGTVIRIEPGSEATWLQDGDTLAGGGREPDLSTAINGLVAKLSELLDDVRGIMNNTVDPMLVSINAQIEALQHLVVADSPDNGALLKDVAAVLNNLKQLTGDLANPEDKERDTDIGKLVRATRLSAEHVETITAAINSRTREIRKAVEQFTQLGGRLNRLVANTGPSVERSLSDTQYIIQETATALTPILNSIDETTRNLLELSRDLRDNPGVLLGGRNTRDNAPESYR